MGVDEVLAESRRELRRLRPCEAAAAEAWIAAGLPVTSASADVRE